MNYTDSLVANRAASAQDVTSATEASSIKKTRKTSTYGEGTAYEFTLRTRIGDYTYIVQKSVVRKGEWELRRVEFDNPYRNRLIVDELSTVEQCVRAAIRDCAL